MIRNNIKVFFCMSICFMFLLMYSCKNDNVITSQALEAAFGNNYKIAKKDSDIFISIINAPIISNISKTQQGKFTYEQFASNSALLISQERKVDNIDAIIVEIIDGSIQKKFLYKVSDLKLVDAKFQTVKDFSHAIIDNDFGAAKKFYSDTLQSWPDEQFNNYFIKRYFSYGQFVKFSLIGFRITKTGYIHMLVDYSLSNGKRQTYILLFKLYGDNKIVDIHYLPKTIEP